MRGLLTFLVVLAIVFFVVGETRGWYVGIPGQTPILVYKKGHFAETTRRTLQRTDMPVRFTGEVKRGAVTIEVRHQQPSSFQTNQAAGAQRTLFKETYRAPQRIALDRVFESGGGVYSVMVTYEDATGVFRLEVPGGVDL